MRHRFGGGYEPEPTKWWEVVAIVAILLFCLAIDACAHQAFQGDWQCAFKRCVFVK